MRKQQNRRADGTIRPVTRAGSAGAAVAFLSADGFFPDPSRSAAYGKAPPRRPVFCKNRLPSPPAVGGARCVAPPPYMETMMATLEQPGAAWPTGSPPYGRARIATIRQGRVYCCFLARLPGPAIFDYGGVGR